MKNLQLHLVIVAVVLALIWGGWVLYFNLSGGYTQFIADKARECVEETGLGEIECTLIVRDQWSWLSLDASNNRSRR